MSSQEDQVDFYDDLSVKVANIGDRMNTVTYLMVTITIIVILVLLANAGLAFYSLWKKKGNVEAPTQIVIKEKGEKRRKSKKRSRSSRRKGSRSSRSKKCGSSRTCPLTKAPKEYPSKEMMVRVEMDKEEDKKGKKAAVPPPTVDVSIPAPPSYEATKDNSQKTESEKATAPASSEVKPTSTEAHKDTVSVTLDKEPSTFSAVPPTSVAATPMAPTQPSSVTTTKRN